MYTICCSGVNIFITTLPSFSTFCPKVGAMYIEDKCIVYPSVLEGKWVITAPERGQK
jgi:hypothetical protein